MTGEKKRETNLGSVTQNLAEFLRDDKYVYKYKGVNLPLEAINVLPQPRKTFPALEELSLDIAKKGLCNPPTIARFSRKGAKEYLKLINLLWSTPFSLRDLQTYKAGGPAYAKAPSGKQEFFYVLLAGERRIRACKLLMETGCVECREREKNMCAESDLAVSLGLAMNLPNPPVWRADIQCFRKHFPDGVIETRACFDIPPLAAIFIQHSENTHLRVPPHEEARAYFLLFKLLRQADPKYSIARFARKLGRNTETVKNALLFCDLPDEIQDAVSGGLVSYGIGVELARLQEKAKLSEEEVAWWFRRAVTENYKVPEFRGIAIQYLRHQESGQMSLLGIMEENRQEMLESRVRQTVEANTVKAIYSWLYYIRRVLTLFEEGKLGKKDSPFSEASPVRLTRKLCAELQRLFVHLEGLLKDDELFEMRRQVALVDMALSYLDAKPPSV